jgi:phosphoglycolate phosphatase
LKFLDKELIIFDLDGTLIDSVPDLASSINHMLKSLNKTTFDENTIRSWVGNGASVLVKRALSSSSIIDTTISNELFEEALMIFLKHYSQNLCVKTKTYNDVEHTLHMLKSKGYILSIVTNKPYEFIEPILSGLGIDDLFSYYIGANSLEVKKPDPKPLLHVCQRFDLDTKKAIMIGDSKNDIVAANRANMQSIAVSYGYNYAEDISVYNPTIKIDNFKDILHSLV